MNTKLKALFSTVFIFSVCSFSLAQSAFDGKQGSVLRSPLAIYGGQVDAAAMASNGNLYVGLNSPNGIFCSSDGAATWEGSPQGSDFGTIAAIATGETDDVVYLIGGINLYKSVDACASWTELESSTGVSDFGRAVAYGHGALIVGFRNGTVEVSTDNGASFTNVIIDGAATDVPAIASSPAEDTFFALVTVGSSTAKLYKSTTAGASWTYTGKSGNYLRLAVDPKNANKVVLVGPDLIELSTNAGSSFNDISPSNVHTAGISFVSIPSQADRIFVGTLWTNNDGGSWFDLNQTASSIETDLRQFIFQDPSNPNKYYISSNRGMAVSSDATNTWTDSVEGMLGVTVNDIAQATDKNYVYLAGTAGLAKSENFITDSRSWTYPIDPGGNGDSLYSLHLPDPNNADTVLAGGSSRIYKSVNGGVSWTPLDVSGITGNNMIIMDFAQTADGKIYAAFGEMGQSGEGGVLLSSNDGDSWSDAFLPNNAVVNKLLAIDNVLYAGVGTENDLSAVMRGIYKLEGGSWTQLSGAVVGEKINDLVLNALTFSPLREM